MTAIKLGVNIDHVATLRQARRVAYPDIVVAAAAAEAGGADGITVHLREDRRHIQDADVEALAPRVRTKLNLEIAAVEAMTAFACRLAPRDVCIVPERREELTTEGGLDVSGNLKALARSAGALGDAGVRVSLFVDPDATAIDAARDLKVDAVELHTGSYANAADGAVRASELERIRSAAARAADAGLIVNAGHGLTLDNVAPIAAIPELLELNIGHSIVADAVFVGLAEAVRRMKERMVAAREGRL